MRDTHGLHPKKILDEEQGMQWRQSGTNPQPVSPSPREIDIKTLEPSLNHQIAQATRDFLH